MSIETAVALQKLLSVLVTTGHRLRKTKDASCHSEIKEQPKKREKKNDAKVLLTQADMNEVKKVGRPRKVLAKLS